MPYKKDLHNSFSSALDTIHQNRVLKFRNCFLLFCTKILSELSMADNAAFYETRVKKYSLNLKILTDKSVHINDLNWVVHARLCCFSIELAILYSPSLV